MSDESNDPTSFVLDLDIKEFTASALEAKSLVTDIGNPENLSGLLEGLVSAAPLLGALGISALAFKEAIDLTVEGEQIERVNQQFETLAEHAGLAPSILKEGLIQAGQGLISTNNLLSVSNGALVKLSGSADKLPQILDLAVKATQVYGGTATQNYEAISNAIANGNVRALKHYGIIVDTVKAEKDFAQANGTTADQLSAAGKQQAILNAALEAGGKAFEGIELNSKSATSALQMIKTTFSEIGETFTLVFEKTIGPSVRNFLGGVQHMATTLKNTMVASLGEGSEQAAAKLALVKDKVGDIEERLRKLNAVKGTALDFAPGDTISSIQSLNAELGKYKDQLTTLQARNKQIAEEEAKHDADKIAGLDKVTAASIIDEEKKKKAKVAFEKELSKIDSDYYVLQQQNINSLSQLDSLVDKQKLQNNK